MSIPASRTQVAATSAGSMGIRGWRTFWRITSLLSVLVLTGRLQAITVTVCDETSLRSAIQNGGNVDFSCDGTIVLSQPIDVTQNVSVSGSGRNVTISGNNTSRLFVVSAGIECSLYNLTLADGRAIGGALATGDGESTGGGAILNNGGSVRVIGCVLTNNSAVGGQGIQGNDGGNAQGGAIRTIDGTLLISNCVLISNSATGGPGDEQFGGLTYDGGAAQGGALYASNAHIQIIRSKICGSIASGGAQGGPILYRGRGGFAFGGAFCAYECTVDMSQVELSLNSAVGRSGGRFTFGPGLAYGGAAYFSNTVVDIDVARFMTNTAQSGFGRSPSPEATYAGAVYNAGRLNVSRSILQGNRAIGGLSYGQRGNGGAVFNAWRLVVNSSTIVSNFAIGGAGGYLGGTFFITGGVGAGGGVYNAGELLMTNTTVAFNVAEAGHSQTWDYRDVMGAALGGGLFHEVGTSILSHVTVAENSAITTAPVLCAGIASSNSGVRLQNCILAYNAPGTNCFGSLVDDGNNISSDASCSFTAPGSLSSTDPSLGPLDNFGGVTPVMLLLPGSPAIDRAASAWCPSTDQRGWPRPYGIGCDIGAFEMGPPFSIRGRVTGYVSPEGISISAGPSSAVSSASGTYIVWGLPSGSHSVSAASADSTVLPKNRTVSVSQDVTGIDFRSYRFNSLTVDGYSNQAVHLVFAASNASPYEVQTGTNLINWAAFATNTVGPEGVFHLFYTNQLELRRFFRTLQR